MDPYETLGVGKDATPEEVKRAYRKRARATHPDQGGKTEEFQRVNSAYQLLSDPGRRARYDETGDSGEQPNSESAMLLMALATLVLNVVNSVDVNRVDVIAEARKRIDADIAATEVHRKEAAKRVNKLERALKRVTRKGGGENMVAHILKSEIAKLEGARAAAKNNIEMLKKLHTMAGEYEYQVDTEPEAFIISNQTTRVITNFDWKTP